MNRVLRLAVLFCISTSASLACTPPPPESISLTWPPGASVSVLIDSQLNTFNAATTAINNWNNGLFSYCYAPVLMLGAGPNPTMYIFYGPIAIDPNGLVRRGKTIITTSGRITSALATINSNISTNFPGVITEVIAHEIGHTMGLNDCNYYQGCPLFSSVMVNNAPIPQWTGVQGQPGPTQCDLDVMVGVAPDYLCPPPAPCPGSCSPALDSNQTATPPDYCTYPATGCGGDGYYDCGGCCCGPTSPILIDTTGQGFYLTSAQGGVRFDFLDNGHPIQMAWTAPGTNNAFLVLPGADGLVHNGKQLFGNLTSQPVSKNPNGFAALAVYDLPANGGNGDGIIDARDAIFSSLRLWIDANHDGISQPEELHTLPSLGVTSISLNYKLDRRTDQYGNVFRDRAQVNPGDPTNTGRMAYDVFFVTLHPPTTKNNPPSLIPNSRPSLMPVDAHKCAVPATKEGMLATGKK